MHASDTIINLVADGYGRRSAALGPQRSAAGRPRGRPGQDQGRDRRRRSLPQRSSTRSRRCSCITAWAPTKCCTTCLADRRSGARRGQHHLAALGPTSATAQAGGQARMPTRSSAGFRFSTARSPTRACRSWCKAIRECGGRTWWSSARVATRATSGSKPPASWPSFSARPRRKPG